MQLHAPCLQYVNAIITAIRPLQIDCLFIGPDQLLILVFQFTKENFRLIRKQIYSFLSTCLYKRNGSRGERRAASSYAWPSVGRATVAKRRTIVKCDWSDNFDALLERLGHR